MIRTGHTRENSRAVSPDDQINPAELKPPDQEELTKKYLWDSSPW